MFDRPSLYRARLIAAPLSVALAAGACGNEASAPADQPAAAEPATPAQDAGPPVEKAASQARIVGPETAAVTPRELTIEQISGGWRVVRVMGAKPGSQTANMNGAIAEIYPESASWSFKPKGAGALNDFCQEPVAGIILAEQAERAGKTRFARTGTRLADNAVLHELKCASGGAFGDSDGAGTDIAVMDADTMAMTWNDGAVLILEKLMRPDAKENMQPQDYQASDFKRD